MVNPEQLTALRTPAGEAALAAATALTRTGSDPLAAASDLRARGIHPDLATPALTQAALRARARAKFGADAAAMFYTRTGLEQATRAAVATRRAARLAACGVKTLADLGCGIGADTIAAARAGIKVTAFEMDPATAAVAEANLAVLGLAGQATVIRGDARQADLTPVDAVFCDPARRSAAGRRTFHPDSFSPPWDFVAALPRRVRCTVLKLAPGLDHALIPPGAEAQWVSVGGALVEAALWCGPLAQVPRRATLLSAMPGPASDRGRRGGEVQPGAEAEPGERGGEAELTGGGQRRAPVGPRRRFLYDPDSAVVRAGLVAEFAGTIAGNLADAEIAYVYTDTATPTPYGRCLEVIEAVPFSLKRLRAAVRAAGAGPLEIMKRGSPLDPDWLRRQLRTTGDRPLTVVLTRVAGAPTALLCQPPA